MTQEKSEFARSKDQGKFFEGFSLARAIKDIRPSALIGAVAKRGVFSRKVVEALHQVPVIQAISPASCGKEQVAYLGSSD